MNLCRMLTLTFMLTTTISVLSSLASVKKQGCQFPSSWQGIWFQQGVRPYISIEGDTISSKGRCHMIEGGHVMLVTHGHSSQEHCYTCLVFHIIHRNIIQYKETLTCQSSPGSDLAAMCRKIPGDAPLFTLFRVDATSIRCPIQGPQLFSYNFGRGLCKSPLSVLESCTINTRISLKYQACPNVPGTEMKDTQFECLASWKEGRNNYLVVKMEHSHISKDEERFRCILWDTRIKENGDQVTYMSMSGDASCNGLYSSQDGQTLVLHPVSRDEQCSLPRWVRYGKMWQSLDMKLKLEILLDKTTGSAAMSVMRGKEIISGSRYYSAVESSKMVCTDVRQVQDDTVRIVMHETRGCTTGYVCTEITRLHDTVMELKFGKMSLTKEYACDKEYFNESTPSFTLVGGPSSPCPLSGIYNVNIRQSDFSLAVKPDEDRMSAYKSSHQCTLQPYTLHLGCSQHDKQDMVWSSCVNGVMETSSHQCVTHWENSQDGKHYFITQVSNRAQYSCYSYNKMDQLIVVEMLGTQCKLGDINSFPFNITKHLDCKALNTSDRLKLVKTQMMLMMIVLKRLTL